MHYNKYIESYDSVEIDGSGRHSKMIENVWIRIKPYFPLLLVFISGLGFSIQGLIVKLLSENGYKGSFSCVLSRGICQTIVSAIFIYFDENRRKNHDIKLFGNTTFVRLMITGRCIIGYGGIAFTFLAIELIPMGDASVLSMLGPIFTAFLAFIVLKEPWRLPELLGTILSLIGSSLVAKPTFIFGGTTSPNTILGVIYALIAAVTSGGAYLFIRILGTSAKMPFTNICFAQGLSQIALSIPSAYLSNQHIQLLNIGWTNTLYIITGGVVGCFSQFAMTFGMQKEKSAAASAMRMSDIVFGYIWQVIFTKDPVDHLSIIGAVLVMSSIILIVLSKQIPQPDPNLKLPTIELTKLDDSSHTPMVSEIVIQNDMNDSSSSKIITKLPSNDQDDDLPATLVQPVDDGTFLSDWKTKVKSMFIRLNGNRFKTPTKYQGLDQQSQHGNA